MEKPDWKQHAQALLPLLGISAGLIAGVELLPPDQIVTSLGTNLAASGITALCSLRPVFAGKAYKETLANHDILRLIRSAWGEAADASVKAYAEAHKARGTDSLSFRYAHHSCSPKLLWFFGGHELLVRSRGSRDRLVDETVEQLASTFRLAPVEAKCEFIQVVV